MHPQRWLISNVNTFECLEAIVGKKNMSVSTSEIVVQFTGVELTEHHNWASHTGTTVWSIVAVSRLTVLEQSAEEQENIQHW